jgi:hypothetical protein
VHLTRGRLSPNVFVLHYLQQVANTIVLAGSGVSEWLGMS